MTSAATPPAYAGRSIGGWLILPAIGLIVTPLLQAAGIILVLCMLGSGILARAAGGTAYVGMAIVLSLGLIALDLCAAVAFFAKKRHAPKWMIALLCVGLLNIPMEIWGNMVFDTTDVKGIVRPIAAASIWIPYFLMSERVKATFVR